MHVVFISIFFIFNRILFNNVFSITSSQFLSSKILLYKSNFDLRSTSSSISIRRRRRRSNLTVYVQSSRMGSDSCSIGCGTLVQSAILNFNPTNIHMTDHFSVHCDILSDQNPEKWQFFFKKKSFLHISMRKNTGRDVNLKECLEEKRLKQIRK